jgi:hypothetical protein
MKSRGIMQEKNTKLNYKNPIAGENQVLRKAKMS